MRRASFTRGLVSFTRSNGASQPSISRRSSGFSGSQISTTPGSASGSARCGGKPPASELTLAAISVLLNTRSTAAQNAFAGAERVLELAEDEVEAGARMPALEIAPHLGEFLGRRVLERIDRLLLVADRKDGARDRPRAGAGGEFVGEVDARSAIASCWCPAPRRSAHGRCRDRACSAPRRHRRCPSSASALSMRSS